MISNGKSKRLESFRERLAALLVALLFGVSSRAAAQPARHVVVHTITTSIIGAPDSTDYIGQTNTFKALLEQHGYQTDRCEVARSSLEELRKRITQANQASYGRYDRRAVVVAQQQCAIPDEDVELLEAVLTLRDDEKQHRKTATVMFYSSDDKPPIVGGYANKVGEETDWETVLNKAISRTLGGANDRTVIVVSKIVGVQLGDTARLSALESWDPDGDPFELKWAVTTTACVGERATLPLSNQPCPKGTKRQIIAIDATKGERELTVAFVPPMIGDYDVAIHAEVGKRKEPPVHYRVRVTPKRANDFFASVKYLKFPRNFVRSNGERDPALWLAIGYTRQLTHRVGLLGFFEDINLGLSLNSLAPVQSFDFSGVNTGAFLQVEAEARELDPTGQFGISLPVSVGGGPLVTQRKIDLETEWVFTVSTMLAGYFSLGTNYVSGQEVLCSWFCPSFTAGPVITYLQNVTTKKRGLSAGVELRTGVEF